MTDGIDPVVLDKRFVEGECFACLKPICVGQCIVAYEDAGWSHKDCDNPYKIPKHRPAGTDDDPACFILAGDPMMLVEPRYKDRQKEFVHDGAVWHPMSEPVDIMAIGKLAEELGECGAAAARCILQGIDEREPSTGKSNRQWLEEEIADVLANVEETIIRFGLDNGAIERRKSLKISYLRIWHKPTDQECRQCDGAGYFIHGPSEQCCGNSEWECGADGCTGPIQIDNRTPCPDCDGTGKSQ